MSPVTRSGAREKTVDKTWPASEHFQRGIELLATGDEPGAFEHFEAAHSLDGSNPRYRSFHGLGLAVRGRRFNQALELCQSAAREEFGNADLYLNLAKVHLAFGFKPEGIRYLKRSLMIEPDHEATLLAVERLGMRRASVLPFLPRRHPLNRWLGWFRRRFSSEADGARADEQPPLETKPASG